MMMKPILEADSLAALEAALTSLAAELWKAKSCHYLVYDEQRQVLLKGEQEWELTPLHQPGTCALTLRPCQEQNLDWPEGIRGSGSFRISHPIFNWGSLHSVLCLSFDGQPGELEQFSALEDSLGIVSARVRHLEQSNLFMRRCVDFFVHAVETRGTQGHVERCCRLATSLAKMLDCSGQVQAHLMEASQCHDLGLLTFADPKSAEALREHARVGATLLRSNPDLHEVSTLVENHHERYDGSGMPVGKSGDDLPLECWILSLVEDFVECWEASHGDYKSRVTEFFTNNAKHHHPDVVDALCGLVDSDSLRELFPTEA